MVAVGGQCLVIGGFIFVFQKIVGTEKTAFYLFLWYTGGGKERSIYAEFRNQEI